MQLPGIHLTRIGEADFLLEPLRSLSITQSGALVEGILNRLIQARAARMYYDLAEQAIIDPVYYDWLNHLAGALEAINVCMICVHMQPTAAYGLVQFSLEPPRFQTALGISDW